jgi:transposase-like protein
MTLGRRSQLETNQKKIEAFLNYLRLGHYINQACAMVGLAESTFYYWRKEAEEIEEAVDKGEVYEEDLSDSESNLLEFLVSVKKARASAEAHHLAKVREDPSWQSSAWWLERSFPDRWGRKDRVEVTGKDEGPLIVEVEFSD